MPGQTIFKKQFPAPHANTQVDRNKIKRVLVLARTIESWDKGLYEAVRHFELSLALRQGVKASAPGRAPRFSSEPFSRKDWDTLQRMAKEARQIFGPDKHIASARSLLSSSMQARGKVEKEKVSLSKDFKKRGRESRQGLKATWEFARSRNQNPITRFLGSPNFYPPGSLHY